MNHCSASNSRCKFVPRCYCKFSDVIKNEVFAGKEGRGEGRLRSFDCTKDKSLCANGSHKYCQQSSRISAISQLRPELPHLLHSTPDLRNNGRSQPMPLRKQPIHQNSKFRRMKDRNHDVAWPFPSSIWRPICSVLN